MKLIKPSFEILEQKPRAIAIPDDMEIGPRKVREELLNSIYRQIEIAGRICYKSEDKITEDSAKSFVERMIKAGHGAMLEHGTVYMKRYSIKDDNLDWARKYNLSPYAWVSYGTGSHRVGKVLYNTIYVTTNLRVLVEGNCLRDLEYLCEPTEYHEKRITVKFICDRGVSHEFVRHRVFSFAQESTRYCNYSKDKFGNELTFIIPCWLDIPEGRAYWHDGINYRVGSTEEDPFGESVNFKAWVNKKSNYVEVCDYIQALDSAEKAYFRLMDKWENRVADRRYTTGFKGNPWTPQQARAVLPNSLKTELVMTGFVSDWKHFFELRCSSSAHPQARELAIPLQEEFIARGYINN